MKKDFKNARALNIVKRDLRKAKAEYLAKEVTEERLREDFPGVKF